MNYINNVRVILLILFLVAVALRFYLLPENLFFGPEQGIDFAVIKNIVIDHKLTLIGSKTDISGIFHGPLYYYLAAVPFAISGGNPVFISLFFVVLNSVTVIFIYVLGKELFNKRVGLIAACLFTVSFSAIMYARWLSNPPLSISLVCLFFLFLHRFLKEKKQYLLFASLVFGLLTQVQFLNLIMFSLITLVFIVVFYTYLRPTRILHLFASISIASFISLGTFFLFDLRHEFLTVKGLLKLITGSSGYYVSYADTFVSGLTTFSLMFLQSVGIFNIFVAGILATVSIILLLLTATKNKDSKNGSLLILLWLGAPLIVLILLRHSILDHYFIPLIPAMILMFAFTIDILWRHSKIVGFALVFLVLGAQVNTLVFNIPQNRNISFQSAQPDLKLSDQISVINTIYAKADGKPFSFQSYTIPYWSQQGWEYLFWYYGEKKYGYYPVPEKAKKLFVIVQVDESNKSFQDHWLKETVSKWGSLENTFKYGILTVRELKTDKN